MASPAAPQQHDLAPFRHSHSFADHHQARRQQALGLVALLTLITMAVELVAGRWTASLALTADGWHMGTHALALGGAWAAYRLSTRAATHAGYAFGGWKIEVLAGYTSALALLAGALWLALDAALALREPRVIAYREAALVAAIGLGVNLLSAWLLMRGGDAHHHHGHDDADDHHDHHHPHDHNFRAALLHVLADALTSVLALAALAGAAWRGWVWLDPLVALLGAAIIAQWSWSMLRASGRALVDATSDPALLQAVREHIETDGDAKVADLHVWQVGASAWCAAISVVADRPMPAATYRRRLDSIERLRHVTVEVHGCNGCGVAGVTAAVAGSAHNAPASPPGTP